MDATVCAGLTATAFGGIGGLSPALPMPGTTPLTARQATQRIFAVASGHDCITRALAAATVVTKQQKEMECAAL